MILKNEYVEAGLKTDEFINNHMLYLPASGELEHNQ